MGTHGLKSPSTSFSATPLPVITVCPTQLIRVSWRATDEPYFGRSASCRFDDSNLIPTLRAGTCYLGFTLACALAESVLHDASPVRGMFHVSADELSARFALQFTGPMLNLADLTGAALKRMGGNGELTGSSDYVLSQEWSKAVRDHPDQVDGFLYMSRHLNTERAVVLFERDSARPLPISMRLATPLINHPDFLKAVTILGVQDG